MRIKKKLAILAGCLLFAASPCGVSRAAVDMFLKIEGVEGETHDVPLKGASDVAEWHWGMQKTPAIPGRPTRVNVFDVTLRKWIDKASPKMMQACASGKHYDRATITMRKQGGAQVEFVRVVMEDVFIAGIQLSSEQDLLHEEITINFARVGIEYFTILGDGKPGERGEFAWNIPEDKPGGVTFPGGGNPDADNDGLPDAWERQFGFDPAVNEAGLDKDGDGATNREEYIAGTNPTSANQVFKSILAVAPGRGPTLSWSSVAGKTYRILIGMNLDTPFQTHSTVPSSGDGTTSVNLPVGAQTGFYRVEVLP